MSTYHPAPELLFDYASGSLTEGVALAIASHLSFCGHCQDLVDRMETVGGAMLSSIPEEDVSADAFATVLDRLDEPGLAEPKIAEPMSEETLRTVPPPLRAYLGRDLDRLNWRGLGRGIEESVLPMASEGTRVSLLRVEPGRTIPSHGHDGNEYTLLLTGGFADGDRNYVRGDFATGGPDLDHSPVTHMGETCLCLVVLDAPTRLTGPIGRFLNPFRRF